METHDMKRCPLLSADIQTYSRMHVEAQYRAQKQFNQVIEEAARHAGLRGAEWTTQNSGDGRLVILPHGTSESAVVGPMAHHMDALLREFNRDLRDDVRVRVRMAVHEGIIHTGDNGFPSNAINLMCHMRDSAVVKEALSAFPDAGLVLLVTDRIYDDIVEQGYNGIRKDQFRRVQVPTKHGRQTSAWISVLNEDVNRVRLSGEDDDASAAPETDAGGAASGGETGAPAAGMFQFGQIHSSGAMAFGPESSAHVHGRGGE